MKTKLRTKTAVCTLITLLMLFGSPITESVLTNGSSTRTTTSPVLANESTTQLTVIFNSQARQIPVIHEDGNIYAYLQSVAILFDRYIPFDDVANIWYDGIPKVCILSTAEHFGFHTEITDYNVNITDYVPEPAATPAPTPSPVDTATPTPVPTPRPTPSPTPRATAPRTRQPQQIRAGVSNFVDERIELMSVIKVLTGLDNWSRWDYWGQVPTTDYQQRVDRHFREFRNHSTVNHFRQHEHWWIFYNITRIGNEFVCGAILDYVDIGTRIRTSGRLGSTGQFV